MKGVLGGIFGVGAYRRSKNGNNGRGNNGHGNKTSGISRFFNVGTIFKKKQAKNGKTSKKGNKQ